MVMHTGHSITKCKSCGDIIQQCRCFSKDKPVYWVVCDKCQRIETPNKTLNSFGLA